ncbi:hypothetical protein MSG28_015076 [Choristoneura fumiferana]|uniref:Uncharacterized protein n=1 Tax=Choristoneura fumiferana TaxID=7141 RepID=A0ACC0KYC0_CHOFU|nr:hypothetical protein MSG28_015076 [Choristoneura fumiferana]
MHWDDGTVEYFNNIIVQPHLRLVTGQGRGYHVRCRYRRRDLAHFHVYPRASALSSNALNDEDFDEDSGQLPSVTMKIYKGDPEDKQEPCSHKRRVRRQEATPATVEVFSGLYVNEQDSPDNDEVTSEKKDDEICISQRNFAIGICIAGVILMACVLAAIACILARRRGKSHSGSSLYSGPYTNTGYSHAS